MAEAASFRDSSRPAAPSPRARGFGAAGGSLTRRLALRRGRAKEDADPDERSGSARSSSSRPSSCTSFGSSRAANRARTKRSSMTRSSSSDSRRGSNQQSRRSVSATSPSRYCAVGSSSTCSCSSASSPAAPAMTATGRSSGSSGGPRTAGRLHATSALSRSTGRRLARRVHGRSRRSKRVRLLESAPARHLHVPAHDALDDRVLRYARGKDPHSSMPNGCWRCCKVSPGRR